MTKVVSEFEASIDISRVRARVDGRAKVTRKSTIGGVKKKGVRAPRMIRTVVLRKVAFDASALR